MNPERLHQVLLSPVISEKSTTAADSANQVVFEVLVDATKPEIREAAVQCFGGSGTGGKCAGKNETFR